MSKLIGIIRTEDVIQSTDGTNEGAVLFKIHYKPEGETTLWLNNNIYVTKYPTGNCQMWSISYFNALIINYENTKELLVEIYKRVIKNMLLIDINRSIEEPTIKLFGKRIISNTPYRSTNGSDMNLMLIDTKEFINFIKE